MTCQPRQGWPLLSHEPERPVSSPSVSIPTINPTVLPLVLPLEQGQRCSRCWWEGHSAQKCHVPSYIVNEHRQLNQAWKNLEEAMVRGRVFRPGWMDQPEKSWCKEEQPQKSREFGFSAGSGDSAIPIASHTEAQSDPITTLQLKDRVWDLSCGPAAAQLREVAKIWTGPWILEERVASDLY